VTFRPATAAALARDARTGEEWRTRSATYERGGGGEVSPGYIRWRGDHSSSRVL
jgi:hypothetical protein